ncbi:MAG: alpha-D-ribose 1-methylphosphonate 5-triphosphate diphosphatase, partial [Pseudomonadota bacterium]
MTMTTVLANAQVVLETEVVRGAVTVKDGRIASIDQGRTVPAGATDCEGDYLAPGLIELHTDNLERHMQPRPGVKWPLAAAVLAHDRELAGIGITTVFDALRVGSITSEKRVKYEKYARPVANEILARRAAGDLKISHFLHLR